MKPKGKKFTCLCESRKVRAENHGKKPKGLKKKVYIRIANTTV